MNRVIKFRAYVKSLKKVYPVENLYLQDEYVSLFENDINLGTSFKVKNNEVELMQFTGKITKIGQEIYEDDVLQSPSGGLWIVKWSTSSDSWKCFEWKYEDFTGEKVWSIDDSRYPLGHSLSGLLTYDYKVVGTFYDYKTES